MPSQFGGYVKMAYRVCRACGRRRVPHFARKPFCDERCAARAWIERAA